MSKIKSLVIAFIILLSSLNCFSENRSFSSLSEISEFSYDNAIKIAGTDQQMSKRAMVLFNLYHGP